MSVPVVVGVDGSPESLAAVEWAAGEAVRRSAPLRLLHAWPSPVTALSVLDATEAERQQAAQVLREAEARVRELHPGAGPAVHADLVADDAVRALVAGAGEAGLLVLGSRGLGTVTGFLVGSVAHRVLARADCPVVLVRRGVSPATADGEVVVGVDPHDGAETVLGFAFESAERLGRPLRAVYAWTLPAAYQYAGIAAGVDLGSELSDHAAEELARAVQPWREKYPGVTVVEESLLGRAAQVLAERAPGAELLAVGRRIRRSPLGAHIGAVAHAALHHVPCPVAVVPYRSGRADERTGD
ncbi:universal stress protein [Kitasatospora sp. NPDC054939]